MRLAALTLAPLLVCAAVCCSCCTASDHAPPKPAIVATGQTASRPGPEGKPSQKVVQHKRKADVPTAHTAGSDPDTTEGTKADPAKVTAPTPPPPPPGQPEIRAGAVILEAKWPQELVVSYEPEKSLAWPALTRALAGRTAQTTLKPFATLETKLPPKAAPVPNGDQILGRALARQLQALGWKVSLVGFTKDMLKLSRDDGQTDRPTKNKKKRAESVTFEIEGKGSFVGVYDQARALIDAEVTFGHGEGALRVPVHIDRSVPGEGTATDRLAAARKMVLAEFVRAVFKDRRVEPALVKQVKAR